MERLLQTKRYRQTGTHEWVSREDLLAKVNEIQVKTLTEDFPITQSRQPINKVDETSREECEFCKGKSENNSALSEGIKGGKGTRQTSHPPLWQPKAILLSKLLIIIRQVTQLLAYLLFLLLLLYLASAPPIQPIPETSPPAMIVKSSPDDGGRSSSSSHRPTPPSQSNESPPTDPRTRESKTSPPREEEDLPYELDPEGIQ